jgi:hypothetical protein
MTTQVLRGVLKPDGTLELERPPELPAGPVEVVLHSLPSAGGGGEDWWQYLQRVRAEAEAAGGPFRTRGEIEADREDFRRGDERIEEIYEEIEREKSSRKLDA